MRILFVAAEVAPHVKTGGLADVAGALPAALRGHGHDVRVVMPRYRSLRGRLPAAGPVAATFLPVGTRAEEMRVWRAGGPDDPLYLLDIPAAFERDAVYGEPDDDRRFILFARGTLALLQHFREVEGWLPDIIHAHDWHAALVPHYCRTTHAYTFGRIAQVLTIHNLAYQGRSNPFTAVLAGLGEGAPVEDRLGQGIAGSFNFLARGILSADVVTTVSPGYAREIITPAFGEGLDALLRSRGDRLVGILNGIDTHGHDPAADPALPVPFSAAAPAGKAACKAALQRELGWPDAPRRPLLGIVSRLVEQKGIELLDASVPWLVHQTDAQLVVLGAGARRYQDALRAHAVMHPDRIALRTGYDAALAQRIYGGADAFLMPSRFEPCGLGQLLSLRYGTVPVVRATGGLADTVREGLGGNGFVFHPFDAGHFRDALWRMLQAWRDEAGWAQLRDRGMREDHSWHLAAGQYVVAFDVARRDAATR